MLLQQSSNTGDLFPCARFDCQWIRLLNCATSFFSFTRGFLKYFYLFCLFVYPFVSSFVFIYLFIRLFVYLFIHLFFRRNSGGHLIKCGKGLAKARVVRRLLSSDYTRRLVLCIFNSVLALAYASCDRS